MVEKLPSKASWLCVLFTGGGGDDQGEEEEEDEEEEEEEEEEEDDDDEGEDEEEENQRRYDFRQRKTVVRYQAPQDGISTCQNNKSIQGFDHCLCHQHKKDTTF